MRMKYHNTSVIMNIALPKHKCGLSLEHNIHKNTYEKAEEWIINNNWCEWESEESKQQAIDTDEIWTLQWYPETPIRFYGIAAPTFDGLLRLAHSNDED